MPKKEKNKNNLRKKVFKDQGDMTCIKDYVAIDILSVSMDSLSF